MIYNELKQRGTADFPIEYHYIDEKHSRYDMSAHWHSEIEIIRIVSGTLNVKLNSNNYIASEGDIIFVNSETVHRATPNRCVYECVIFNPEFLNIGTFSCKFFIESLINHEYTICEFVQGDNSDFIHIANRIFDTMKQKSSGQKFKVIGYLYELFGIITDNHLYSSITGDSAVTENKNIPKLKRVLRFIRDNYNRKLTLDEMSQSVDMSPKYFCFFFKKMTGKTPIEYLNSYRVEKATQKLLNSDLSVTEIAYSCGFNDLSYFIKTFKSIKKIPPAQLRKG